MSTATAAPARIPLEKIDTGQNTRPLDEQHVRTLAASIALRGLIVPLAVRPGEDGRFTLVAGHHRHAACRSLGITDVDVTVRDHDGSSADTAAENVVRKQLSPLEEAHAVQRMLEEGYTLDGAAAVLGWNRKLVAQRARILELPDLAQRLIGTGELPVSAVPAAAAIAAVSPALCEAAHAPVAAGEIPGHQFAGNPGWVIGRALHAKPAGVFAAYLSTLHTHDIQPLRLGKAIEAALAEAEALHRQLDRHAYGPPPVRFTGQDVDQARAAGVLVEFDHGAPLVTDRTVFRELAKQAIVRTVEELRAARDRDATERAGRRETGRRDPTPVEAAESEHRAAMRELTVRAHGTNLDLGAALLQKLATVDPADMDVARFFAYGLLGPDGHGYTAGDRTVATLAANGIRLVLDEHRSTSTPTLKGGQPGRTRVEYGDPDAAAAWLWRFVEGARSAGELYGRALVVFAAQHYASDIVLPAAARRGSVLPQSRNDTARKAFERLTKPVLPHTHVQLRGALDREARAHAKRLRDLASPAAADDGATGE